MMISDIVQSMGICNQIYLSKLSSSIKPSTTVTFLYQNREKSEIICYVVVIYFAAVMLLVLVHFKGILFAFDLSSVRCSCMAELRHSTATARIGEQQELLSLKATRLPLKLLSSSASHPIQLNVNQRSRQTLSLGDNHPISKD